jgi:hypothetical protein
MDALVNRVERNGEVAGLLLTNAEARAVALDLMQDVYARLREPGFRRAAQDVDARAGLGLAELRVRTDDRPSGPI